MQDLKSFWIKEYVLVLLCFKLLTYYNGVRIPFTQTSHIHKMRIVQICLFCLNSAVYSCNITAVALINSLVQQVSCSMPLNLHNQTIFCGIYFIYRASQKKFTFFIYFISQEPRNRFLNRFFLLKTEIHM